MDFTMKNTAGKAQAADRIFSAFSSNDWSYQHGKWRWLS
jgi:hypothetical protein